MNLKKIIGLTVVMSSVVLAGCNTVKGTMTGVGQDIKSITPNQQAAQTRHQVQTKKYVKGKKYHHKKTTHKVNPDGSTTSTTQTNDSVTSTPDNQ